VPAENKQIYLQQPIELGEENGAVGSKRSWTGGGRGEIQGTLPR